MKLKNENQFYNEVISLLRLYKEPHFPLLLSVNPKEKSLLLNYCGEPLNKDNVPFDWKKQLNDIIDCLTKHNIYNNDMWLNNFLVNKNTLYLIDFGWATLNKEYYPFMNIVKNDINKFNNFLELLDLVIHRVIEDNIIFINNL